MNIMFFLTHKSDVTYLYDDMGLKEGLDKLQESGYHAIPLISREGEYIGTVTEGDFLWMMCTCGEIIGKKRTVSLQMRDLPRRCDNKAVAANAQVVDLLSHASNQNFVPVIDDRNMFVGIVTRKKIFEYCKELLKNEEKLKNTSA
ncbi:MAG: CBS domain-containing protein [Butyricicoccus pullicaecorum]|nr:CBS domain-containing protein [Butyricicoccus pullicaecorum]